MNRQGSMIFTYRPDSILDLGNPEVPKAVLPYRIVERIALEQLEYENFVADMSVERQYIEDFAPLCVTEDRHKGCLLLQKGGETADGILVIPETNGCVKYAAEYHDISIDDE